MNEKLQRGVIMVALLAILVLVGIPSYEVVVSQPVLLCKDPVDSNTRCEVKTVNGVCDGLGYCQREFDCFPVVTYCPQEGRYYPFRHTVELSQTGVCLEAEGWDCEHCGYLKDADDPCRFVCAEVRGYKSRRADGICVERCEDTVFNYAGHAACSRSVPVSDPNPEP